ncbi:hypothetical protein AAZX31_12G219400 [Glycine max]|nr:hypothetical protein GLYMA_12G230967v4 [Glycine max]KAH1144549.1 hypothetical protein GYH30_034666 [Glycine max]
MGMLFNLKMVTWWRLLWKETRLGLSLTGSVSQEDGELFAVDAINSNIVWITPPLSQYSRGRLVAGSFQGYTGHVDGKPSDALFNHPKGITVDDKGNVYVADTQNLAIRKIGDAGVTTIAGGKSNVAGYRDGPSEDAKFSRDVLFGKSPLTRKIVIISLIQFPVQIYLQLLVLLS